MNLSVRTIEHHKYNVFAALGVDHVATMTRKLVEFEFLNGGPSNETDFDIRSVIDSGGGGARPDRRNAPTASH